MILADAVMADPTVKALCRRLGTAGKAPLGANGLWGSAAPVLAAVLARCLRRPLLYVTAHLEQADNARDDLETVLGRAIDVLPAWEAMPGEGAAASEIGAERTRQCASLTHNPWQNGTDSEPSAACVAEDGVSRGAAKPGARPGLPRAVADKTEASPEQPRRPRASNRRRPPAPADADCTQSSRAASDDDRPVIAAPVQSLLQPVPAPSAIDANSLVLEVGQERDPEEIAAFLTERRFERLDQVEQPGDFALRGGILDVFATADVDPVRIEFFGNQIESIRQFELGSQRSMRRLTRTRLTLPPDARGARTDETTSFLSYLPAGALIVLDEPLEIAEIGRTILDRLGHPVGHYTVEALLRQAAAFPQLHLSQFPLASVAEADAFKIDCESLPPFEPKAADAVTQLVQLAQSQSVIVFCDNEGERQRLGELIAQSTSDDTPTASTDWTVSPTPTAPTDSTASTVSPTPTAPTDSTGSADSPTPTASTDSADSAASQASGTPLDAPQIETVIGLVHRGFCWKTAADRLDAFTSAPARFVVLPHHELFRRYTQRRRIRRVAATRPIETFLDLSEGDYVVHVVHGIGRYVGMKTMRKGDSRKSEEFLTLCFADEATLHVPASQIDLVQKYVGPKGARPPLSKLGGTRWKATKAKVEEAVTDLAAELLRIQAVRESQPGVSYPQDTRWQKEFEDAFLFTETPDQIAAATEIKADLMRTRPTDRLLCGDVGYGKTELAMRAAFKVVEYGKQVAVLVPTTILAEQHFRTFQERMADYPFIVDCLNRFRPPLKQREIVAAAKKGQIDVLIGTHRLLSKDVDFADLGLVIIDEEQRFGVEHKERLKQLRATVDVLTMTATPIPRTLHMAMIGIRDISSLATPPMDRRAIATRVCAWNDELVREAIVRELNRDGQVYFVHNRVQTIHGVAARIASLVPDARVLVGHGQMKGDELEDVMLRFVRHEADVLVCTAIIEAGVDIPNVNTIFIDRAEMFGLADLHQLRGRVGRYKHRAYCYLLLSPNRPLTHTAARRLKAIEEYSDLGAGFHLAMRDLEIRGAGNILGPEQSGNIAAVGYEMYCQVLEQTVKRMRGEPYSPRVAVHLELDVEAYIPKGYIASDRQRMECYRRVTACRTPDDVDRFAQDLLDAFGHHPESVDKLLALADLRVRAAPWNIKAIIKKEPDVIFQIEGEIKKIEPLFAGAGGSVRTPDGRTLHWRVPDNYFHGETLLRVLRNLFRRPEVPTPAPASRYRPSSAQASKDT